MVITVYMYIMRASWKISYYMYTCIYVSAKCCHPHKIKSILTYLLTPEQFAVIILKFEQCDSTIVIYIVCPKGVDGMANSLDPIRSLIWVYAVHSENLGSLR